MASLGSSEGAGSDGAMRPLHSNGFQLGWPAWIALAGLLSGDAYSEITGPGHEYRLPISGSEANPPGLYRARKRSHIGRARNRQLREHFSTDRHEAQLDPGLGYMH